MLGIKQAERRERLRQQFGEKTNAKPCCPSCGQAAPRNRKLVRWAELFGHRCQHGEPCPSFADVPAVASRCSICSRQAQKTG